MSSPIIDIHTHFYPPSYIALLKSRTTVPYIHTPLPTPTSPSPLPRLIILPSDDSPSLPPHQRGRPLDPAYTSLALKLSFMHTHHIHTSIISLANPWLDFLPPATAPATARTINNDFNALCAAAHPRPRLYAFATLPLSAPVPAIEAEIARLPALSHIRGVIIGTSGLGRGLDDHALRPVWAALERARLLVFLHPHYGLPAAVFGERAAEYGHVLPLALGFPLETTVAFTRMYLAGVFDAWPALRVLVAHAGGAVPFLAGRIESCVLHERGFRDAEGRERGRRGLWEVLRGNVWLDAVVYSEVGVRAAVEAVGRGRVLFGTDHPFFPPLEKDEGEGEWASVRMNVDAVRGAFGGDEEGARMVLGGNAVELLKLEGVSHEDED